MTNRDNHAALAALPPSSDGGTALQPAALSLVEPGFSEVEGALDWRRVWSAVVRFKWLILAVTLLGVAAGGAATRFLKPQYLVQATIWIDQADRRGPDRGPTPIRSGQLLEPEAWVDLLRSYIVLDQVVREQRLFLTVRPLADSVALATFGVADHYRPGKYRLTVDSTGQRYTLADGEGVALEHGVVGDSVGARLGFLWVPTRDALGAGRTVRFALATVRDGARHLDEALDVRAAPDGSFLHIELRGAQPARITAIVNAIAQRYVEVAAELKREKVTELTKILDQQVESARQRLRDAEAGLRSFGVRTITLPSGRAAAGVTGTGADRDPALTSFFDLQIEQQQVHQDRKAILQALAQVRDSGVSATALEAIGAVQHNADLAQALKELVTKQADLRVLRYQYTDAYPRVQRLTAEIATLQRQTIPALAQALAGELAAREAELGRRVETGSQNLRQIPPRAIDEARLRRDMTLAENLYATLQQRYEEARLAEASTIPDVRILDSAVSPQRPVKNTAPRIVLFALFASLGLAVAGAVLLDRVDPRVRYPEQVSRGMGLTILGAVPHLRKSESQRQGTGPLSENVAEVLEALRGVCLNLEHAYGTAGPLIAAVTSPGPGEGKSFIAANLAYTFAESGHRVLLVDADIRRGVLHRRLGRPRRPGLCDFLRSEAPLEAIVQSTTHPSLALVGCGTRAHHAPELLGSPAMGQFVAGLRTHYDVILFDNPPLAAGVDPLIVGTLTGNLLLVLRTGQSDREMTAAKLEVLQRLPVRLLGAVLNDVPAGATYRYYSYYLPGYEAVDEEAQAQPLVT